MASANRTGRITVAVAAGGLGAFALLYAPQPVLPQLAEEYGLTPGHASLAIAVATGALAVAVVPLAVLSEVVGRRPVMLASAALAVVLGLALPLAPSFPALLTLRVAQGAAIAGLPAVTMAYLAEELGETGLGAAIGAMVAGNSMGGMLGRLLAGLTVGSFGWRGSFASVAAFGAACAAVLWLALPAQRGSAGKRAARVPSRGRHLLGDRVLVAQYVVAALGMGSFVALYNAVGFRLAAAPLSLPPATAALVFLAYAVGAVSSPLAGRLADGMSDRGGRLPVLLGALAVTVVGVVATLPAALAPIAIGFGLLTGGFFAAHATASGWVSQRAPAEAKGRFSGIYVLSYYLGSSVVGSLGTACYAAWGWGGLVAICAAWLSVAGLTVLWAARTARS